MIKNAVDLLIRVNATLCFIGTPTGIEVYGYDPRWHVYMKVKLSGQVTDPACDGVKVAVCSSTLKQRINALLDEEFELGVFGGEVTVLSEKFRCTLGIPREEPVPELARELNELFMVQISRPQRMLIPRQVDGLQTPTGMITIRIRGGVVEMVNTENGETTSALADDSPGNGGEVIGRLHSSGEATEYEGTFTADWFKKIINARVAGDAFVIFSEDFQARSGNRERAPMVVRYNSEHYEFYLMLTEGVCRTRPTVAANRRGHKQKMRLDKEINEFQ
jgi:hypothetical protein